MIPVIGRTTPPDEALPNVMISGVTPSASHLHIVPVRPIPVWISSKINATPYSSQICLNSVRYPSGGTITPAFALNWFNDHSCNLFTNSDQVTDCRSCILCITIFYMLYLLYHRCIWNSLYVFLPPIEIAPIDLPWNAPTVEIYHLPPVAILASFNAISTASAPPFV